MCLLQTVVNLHYGYQNWQLKNLSARVFLKILQHEKHSPHQKSNGPPLSTALYPDQQTSLLNAALVKLNDKEKIMKILLPSSMIDMYLFGNFLAFDACL